MTILGNIKPSAELTYNLWLPASDNGFHRRKQLVHYAGLRLGYINVPPIIFILFP